MPISRKFSLACIALVTTLLLSATLPAYAQQQTAAEEFPWNAEAELGYLMTTGNTESQTLNVRFDVTREVTKWRHNLHYEQVYAAETSEDTGEEETTAQRFLVSAKTNYKFDAKNSAYLLGLYEDDRFSGYKYQYMISAGYARQFVKTERMELSGELGPGYRFSKLEDETVADDEEKEAIVRLGGFFKYSFNSSAVFTQDVSVEAGGDKTITRSTTALKTQIAGSLAMKISYAVRHTSSVPPGTENTDTETALTLVYSL